MGTRAIITKNGKPFIATHWDGNPENLGVDLKKTKNDIEIAKVASKHSIDFADLRSPAIKKFREERFKKISEKTKGKYSVEKLKELDKKGRQITFSPIMSSDDNPITSISNYGDFAEYQYDFRDGEWFVRPLSGVWTETQHSKTPFKRLEEVI